MADQKHWRNVLDIWNGTVEYTYPGLKLAALMSIREELQKLNGVMQCRNVARGFAALGRMATRDERTFKRRVEAAVKKRLQRKAK
jgi:hypothetical protein